MPRSRRRFSVMANAIEQQQQRHTTTMIEMAGQGGGGAAAADDTSAGGGGEVELGGRVWLTARCETGHWSGA